MLREFDIVTVLDHAPPEVRGKRGYVIGQVTADGCGVFIEDFQMVWCFTLDEVAATGEVVPLADRARGPSIRVSQRGVVLG